MGMAARQVREIKKIIKNFPLQYCLHLLFFLCALLIDEARHFHSMHRIVLLFVLPFLLEIIVPIFLFVRSHMHALDTCREARCSLFPVTIPPSIALGDDEVQENWQRGDSEEKSKHKLPIYLQTLPQLPLLFTFPFFRSVIFVV